MSEGDAHLHGKIILGEGNYQVGWVLRDRAERFCAAFWQISASPRGRDREVKLHIAAGMVEPVITEPFLDEAPAPRETARPLSVLVLLHVAPQVMRSPEMQTDQTQAMVSILRNIAHEPRFTSFSITAFNIDKRAVIYRQANAPKIDFPTLGQAVKGLHFGTVAVQRLGDKDGGPQFLLGLIAGELASQKPVESDR